MKDLIWRYQKAFNIAVDKLKKNQDVSALLVFGSIVTGDLWEGSDIDFFAVVDKDVHGIKNIYTEENEIPIHIKMISKQSFIRIIRNNSINSFLYRMILASKLVFSKDDEITGNFDHRRYNTDLDRQKRDLLYFSDLIKNIDLCNKYISNDVQHSAYCEAVLCMQIYSKLYVNHLGYTISKDVLSVCMDLNYNFKNVCENFLNSEFSIEKRNSQLITFLEQDIEENIKQYTSVLLQFMKEKDTFLSDGDIRNDNMFKGYEIHFEHTLRKLWEMGIIRKDKRMYNFESTKIIDENIYFL